MDLKGLFEFEKCGTVEALVDTIVFPPLHIKLGLMENVIRKWIKQERLSSALSENFQD